MKRAVASLLAVIAACGHAAPATKSETLFVRIGGQDAINGIVKDFVEDEIPHDARIKEQFRATNNDHFEKLLAEQLCAATEGPCKYTGKDMVSAHGTLKITAADFDAFVEDLGKTLDKFHAGAKEKAELLAILGKLEGDIVAKIVSN